MSDPDDPKILKFPPRVFRVPPPSDNQQAVGDLVSEWIKVKDRLMLVARCLCPEFGISLLAQLINAASITQAEIAGLLHDSRPHDHTGPPPKEDPPPPPPPPFPEAL